MFEPPPDVTDEDPTLPAGTIAIRILDPDNVAIGATHVGLGILHQSVAKGESREHKAAETDGAGSATFAQLETGSGVAYRVSVVKDGGTFAAAPFQLPQDKGMRVQLHVYPVTNDLAKTLVVSQFALYSELKDDRVQLEEAITVHNLGRTAWVPKDVVVPMPEGFTAFSSNQQMGDEGVDSAPGGAKLRGTFGPGQHSIQFRWQLPYGGDDKIVIDHGLPPNTATARVLAAASQSMHLVVDGFPQAELRNGPEGERLLVTEKQYRRDESGAAKLHVEIRDLPVEGPAKKIATAIAAIGVILGAIFAFGSRKDAAGITGKDARARLLEELEELERAKRAGDVGPHTYERARRELVDAIARTLSEPAPKRAATPSPSAT
jgi:hypothetical protein